MADELTVFDVAEALEEAGATLSAALATGPYKVTFANGIIRNYANEKELFDLGRTVIDYVTIDEGELGQRRGPDTVIEPYSPPTLPEVAKYIRQLERDYPGRKVIGPVDGVYTFNVGPGDRRILVRFTEERILQGDFPVDIDEGPEDTSDTPAGGGNGELEGPPSTYPPDHPWPPQLMRPITNDSGEVIDYEPIPGTVDWDAYAMILREERLRQEGLQEAPGEPSEQLLDTVTEGGWEIDQYGYIDPVTGEEIITRRQPRQSIKDPILSLDDMIAQALGKVDDWSAIDDPNLQRAQSLFDFKNQPTDAERLRLAMDIAQSPSDYMTLVGLYTGAVSRESPARMGERVAPLMPYLQQMAQKFFLDVPGINEQPGSDSGDFRPQYGRFKDTTPVGDEVPGILVGEPSGDEVKVPLVKDFDAYQRDLSDEADRLASQIDPFTTNIPDGGMERSPTEAEEFWWEQGGQEEKQGSFKPPDKNYTQRVLGYRPQGAGGPGNLTGGESYNEDISKYVENPWYVPEKIPDFESGGIVPGAPGEPTLAKVHGGEMIIPNYIGGSRLQQSGMLGDVWRPDPRIWGRAVSRPARVQIPSMIGGDFRFRSPQTIRRMTPSQRMMFQEGVKSFGYPWEDWRMQEGLATGVGGAGRPRIQFRRPSFVRG